MSRVPTAVSINSALIESVNSVKRTISERRWRPRGERGQRRACNWSRWRIVDSRREPLERGEGRGRPTPPCSTARGRESKPNRPTRSPSFSATKAVSRAAETARSIRGRPASGSRHRAAGVEREDDMVVALGAIFLGEEVGVARRLLPVDRAAVHARAVFGQRIEFGAFADLELGDQAVRRVAARATARRASRTGRMSGVIRSAWSSASRRCFQTRPSGPRQRSQARRNARCRGAVRRSASAAAPAPPVELAPRGAARRRLDQRVGVQRDLGRGAARAPAKRTLERRSRSGADADRGRPLADQVAAARAGADQRVEAARTPAGSASKASPADQSRRQARCRRSARAARSPPRAGSCRRADRSTRRLDLRRSAARPPPRPAAPRSRRPATGSARWRSTAGASALTSSGMT